MSKIYEVFYNGQLQGPKVFDWFLIRL